MIRERNRLKIRHLQLRFSRAQIIRCIREKRFNDPDPVRLPNVSGDHVALAFHLLAQGHNLQTLRISIKQGLSSELLVYRYPFHSYRLLRVALSQIKSIKRLEWVNTADEILPHSPDPEHTETVRAAHDELKKLKQDMESG